MGAGQTGVTNQGGKNLLYHVPQGSKKKGHRSKRLARRIESKRQKLLCWTPGESVSVPAGLSATDREVCLKIRVKKARMERMGQEGRVGGGVGGAHAVI